MRRPSLEALASRRAPFAEFLVQAAELAVRAGLKVELLGELRRLANAADAAADAPELGDALQLLGELRRIARPPHGPGISPRWPDR